MKINETVIVIRGAAFINKGGEAMLRSIQHELCRRISHILFYLLCSHSEAQRAWECGLIPIFAPCDQWILPKGLSRRIWSVLKLKNPFYAFGNRNCLNAAFQRALCRHVLKTTGGFRAIIDISGYSYRGEKSLVRVLQWLKMCDSIGAAYVFMPQTWGPFNNKKEKSLLRKVVLSKALLYTRDSQSRNLVSEASGIPIEKIKQKPDIAFKFTINKDIGKSFLLSSGIICAERPLIGFAVSTRLYDRCKGKGTDNKYIKVMAQLIDYAIDQMNCSGILIANEALMPNTSGYDDRYICSLIHSSIQQSQHCFVLQGHESAEVVSAVISQFSLLVGSRFHTIVFSYGHGIPCMVLGWSFKYHGLLSLFGQEKYLIDLNQLEFNYAQSLFSQLWKNRLKESNTIHNSLCTVSAEVEMMIDEISKTIKSI